MKYRFVIPFRFKRRNLFKYGINVIFLKWAPAPPAGAIRHDAASRETRKPFDWTAKQCRNAKAAAAEYVDFDIHPFATVNLKK
ncbi:hypothetical protein ACFFMP_19525 [Pseudoroseomonas cervicalis]|uniref:Uncharacterized protein n=1 Tax=Pseudoroseomonas cervicalis ATCC 49957 TaxID=525371 RepID=D5RQI4_9PROT|nr:hypothetical protein [Pseudoroseomonas cervicalis]EFH10437.1 hypothetical protein HMPREF0731_3346 [Pseudoroseomonas cervicalis ATCC 49957]